jgi:Lrp/AsnC family transcriptional regulator
MDAIDRKIIHLLQRDGTLTNAAMAEHVGASPASCWRRVRALEAAGILGDTVRLVEPRSVGLNVHVLCHVRLTNHHPETSATFRRFVEGHGAVMECYTMSGEWDYLLRVVVADVESYEAFLMRTLLAHQAVATASSHFALSVVKYTTELPV